MSSRLDDLLAEANRLRAERDSAQRLLDVVEQAVLEERFKDFEKYRVGDIILVPRKLFGQVKYWPAQIALVRLHYNNGYYSETYKDNPGGYWETHTISYAVYLKQQDGTFGGSSEGYDHSQIQAIPDIAQETA